MTLSAWQATVQDANGNIVPSAEVTVLVESTGLPATIYSTRGGAALSNPFTADINGFAQFYANKGEYRITAVAGVFSNIFRYVRIGDAGGYDVQSSPTDATAGRLLTNETTHIGGNVNYTGANFQSEIFDGLKTKALMRNISGGNHANNGTYSGSDLLLCRFTTAGAIQQISGSPSGTWKNVSNGQIAANEYGQYVRIA